MTIGPIPTLVSRLRAVPTPIVGIRIGRNAGSDSAVTVTADGARHLARLLGSLPPDDAVAPDEALHRALARRGLGDVATTREGDNVTLSHISLPTARALARDGRNALIDGDPYAKQPVVWRTTSLLMRLNEKFDWSALIAPSSA